MWKGFTAARPSDIAASTSVGVHTPGISGKPSRNACSTTSRFRPGATSMSTPASKATSAWWVDVTVPAMRNMRGESRAIRRRVSPILLSPEDERRDRRVVRIGPLLVGDARVPAGPARVAVVRIAPQLLVERRVTRHSFRVQPDAEARPIRHGNGAVAIRKLAALDDVVGQVVVVGVGAIAVP